MAVYVNNITINTGEYFSRDFYLDNIDGTPLNLTGYTAASQVRKHPESVYATANFTVGFVERANVDEGTGPGSMTRSTDGPVVASNFPATLHYNASATFSGGTAVYTVGTNVTAAYERVGLGLVYVTGDTNTFDPGNFATVGQEIYSALRALVLNS